MNKYLISLCLLLGITLCAPSDHWAVIVAGSNGFWNYRHQADACHAYHIMKRNNIPEEQIILMSYDDVANNRNNPIPGTLFNQPNGVDVYEGCKIDYSGKDVTPANFVSVMKGDAAALQGVGNGKVLKSNENSRVFVFFVDHGAPGLIAFPSEYLYADKLNQTLNYMYTNNMYKQMVFYIEACESGSMFEGILPENINIYGVTAANAHESSWGYYCYPDDVVNGTHIGTCLGDLFAINWMENADAVQPDSETLEEQFKYLLDKTTKSHVMRYGDMQFTNEVIGDFEGDLDIEPGHSFAKLFKKRQLDSNNGDKKRVRSDSSISSRDAKLHYLYSRVMSSADHKTHLDLSTELNRRMKIDHVFEELGGHNLLSENSIEPLPRNFDCLRNLMNTYETHCGRMDDYDLKYVKHFVSHCELNEQGIDSVINNIQIACSK